MQACIFEVGRRGWLSIQLLMPAAAESQNQIRCQTFRPKIKKMPQSFSLQPATPEINGLPIEMVTKMYIDVLPIYRNRSQRPTAFEFGFSVIKNRFETYIIQTTGISRMCLAHRAPSFRSCFEVDVGNSLPIRLQPTIPSKASMFILCMTVHLLLQSLQEIQANKDIIGTYYYPRFEQGHQPRSNLQNQAPFH